MTLIGLGSVALVAAALIGTQLPAAGAGALLHPARRHDLAPTPGGCENATFDGAGLTLKGWRCRTSPPRRGAIVFLHGIADNRTGAAGVITRFDRLIRLVRTRRQ